MTAPRPTPTGCAIVGCARRPPSAAEGRSGWCCDRSSPRHACDRVSRDRRGCRCPVRGGDPTVRRSRRPAHQYRAYQVSEGSIRAERQGDRVGGFLPTSLRLSPHDRPWRGAPVPLRAEERAFVDFRNTALYAPVPTPAARRCHRGRARRRLAATGPVLPRPCRGPGGRARAGVPRHPDHAAREEDVPAARADADGGPADELGDGGQRHQRRVPPVCRPLSSARAGLRAAAGDRGHGRPSGCLPSSCRCPRSRTTRFHSCRFSQRPKETGVGPPGRARSLWSGSALRGSAPGCG